MRTTKVRQPTGGRRQRRLFRDFLPSAAADAELTWFFNEAKLSTLTAPADPKKGGFRSRHSRCPRPLSTAYSPGRRFACAMTMISTTTPSSRKRTT